ncbi:ABC transporter permease [Sphingopyxis sp. JAI128]|uniref:ABC transporter permease n=1 Tax=Sphingopyxis sp. JAI128 TaxID=2723066 RepID=UPI00161A723F|nr:ABC transporter permease [Sphingopyxis sp. JAI128]MBB6426923.1 putative ABC transport system permease protein [Sphingopyxis sp. JAI128]
MIARLWRSLAGWGINVAIALTALRVNLMRSILTTLGVMIGVFSVILAVAIGAGAQVSVTESIGALGANMAIVVPEPDSDGPRRTTDRGRLTERDIKAIAKQVPGITATAPQLRTRVQLVAAGRNTTTEVIGATPDYAIVSNVNTDEGRFIEQGDANASSRIAVLGQTVATRLFGSYDPVGETVRINRVPFRIVGLLESKGSSFGNDNDDLVIVPLGTLRQRLLDTPAQGPDDIHIAFVGFDDEPSLIAGQNEIKKILRDRYRVAKGKINPFTVRTTTEIAEVTGEATQIFQALLVAIASISLLVGGIGIMNIMLVSVTERTREIGLRMALGAKRADIRNQFLVEAAVLCVIGGGVGLALAKVAALAFVAYADFPAPIGFGVAVGAILFSAVIGLAFGGWPAIRASRLSPIEALRSE